ncbi:hypothetical protein FHT92_001913 [Rhizobium sp. BK377]|nr:hypothetical protein [Rhizobium sp. BK377]
MFPARASGNKKSAHSFGSGPRQPNSALAGLGDV